MKNYSTISHNVCVQATDCAAWFITASVFSVSCNLHHFLSDGTEHKEKSMNCRAVFRVCATTNLSFSCLSRLRYSSPPQMADEGIYSLCNVSTTLITSWANSCKKTPPKPTTKTKTNPQPTNKKPLHWGIEKRVFYLTFSWKCWYS